MWAGAAIFVVGNVLVPSGVLLAERTLYLASAGIALTLGSLWALCTGNGPGRRPRSWCWLSASVPSAPTTRSEIWRDDDTFFPPARAGCAGSYRADWVAACSPTWQGDSVEGRGLMRRGFGVYAGNGAMLSDFAVVMERQRRWDEAAEYFWRSFQADSGRASDGARAVANLIQGGRLDSAQVLLQAAQRVQPDSPDLAISESHLALARGDAPRSVALRRRVAEQIPGDWRYWHLTAEAAMRARDCTALREAVQRWEALRPGMRRAAQLVDSARVVCGNR